MIYVTNDQIEAMTLADRIVLMRDGIIEQQGSPLELFERPVTRFAAGFLGSPQMNFVTTRLSQHNGQSVLLFDEDRKLPIDPARAEAFEKWQERDVILGVRPEHIHRAGANGQDTNGAVFHALVDLVQPTGTRTYIQFRLNETEITAELPSHGVDAPGTRIDLSIDMKRIILIDPQTQQVIPG